MGDTNHMEQIQYVTDTASMITKFQSKFVKVHACIVFRWINYSHMRVFCFHICEEKQHQHYFRLFSLQVNSNKSWAKNNCLMGRWHLRTAYDNKKLICDYTIFLKKYIERWKIAPKQKQSEPPNFYMHIVYLHNFHHFFNYHWTII